MTRTRSERPRDLGQDDAYCPIGYPTEAFKAPMIYNPYFEKAGIDAVVMPMGVKVADYPNFLRELFKVTNIRRCAGGNDAAQEDQNQSSLPMRRARPLELRARPTPC